MRKHYFPNIYILSHSRRKKKCPQKQCSAHPKLWLFKALCKAPAECPKPCLPLLSTALPSQGGRPNLPVSTGEEPKPNCLNSQRLKLERFPAHCLATGGKGGIWVGPVPWRSPPHPRRAEGELPIPRDTHKGCVGTSHCPQNPFISLLADSPQPLPDSEAFPSLAHPPKFFSFNFTVGLQSSKALI